MEGVVVAVVGKSAEGSARAVTFERAAMGYLARRCQEELSGQM